MRTSLLINIRADIGGDNFVDKVEYEVNKKDNALAADRQIFKIRVLIGHIVIKLYVENK